MPPKVAHDDAATLPKENENNVNSSVYQEPLVLSVLKESEDMLCEIDMLRTTVSKLTEQLGEMKKYVRYMELRLANSALPGAQSEVDDIPNTLLTDKIGILRSIMKAVMACQVGPTYARFSARRALPEDATQDATVDNRTFGRALHESNQRLDDASCILRSYQETPSFATTEYDHLMIEILSHVISLSKTLNALALDSQSSFLMESPEGDTLSLPQSRAQHLLRGEGCENKRSVAPTPRLPDVSQWVFDNDV